MSNLGYVDDDDDDNLGDGDDGGGLFYRMGVPRQRRKFDAFVEGGADEAKEFFVNEGKPVHCLSTRFGGVNYRVSMMIGNASLVSKRYTATHNPNYYNKLPPPPMGVQVHVVKVSRVSP